MKSCNRFLAVSFALLPLICLAQDERLHDDSEPQHVKAELKGKLQKWPLGVAGWKPYLEVNKTAWQLMLPGDEYVRDVVDQFIGQLIVITGELQIQPDVLQKDGSRRTEYFVQVRRLKLAKNSRPIIGPTSPDGRWCAVTRQNGLKLYDTTTNKGFNIYEPADAPKESAIDWNPSTTFSPDGKFVYTSHGLRDDLWSLPDMKSIGLRTRNEDEQLVALGYGGFSNDGNFLVMRGYRKSKMPNLLLAFRTTTGQEVARLTFDKPAFGRKFSFLPDGSSLCVVHDGRLTLINLETGRKIASVAQK